MPNDEAAIREWQASWMRLSMAGDIEALAELMDEGVVFFVVGRPPIRGREEFLSLMRSGAGRVRFESSAEMEEVTIHGDWAHCASHLKVAMMAESGGKAMRRSGYALSILRRHENGRWVLIRDANMLSPDPSE
ncbi:MAG: SgcJ/EcaC family oxidoreductase [Gemmatimonadaceae bacterium]